VRSAAEALGALTAAVLDAGHELAYCRQKLELWRCRRCFERTYAQGYTGWRLCAVHARWWLGSFTREAREARRAALHCE